jgi:cytochrome c553
MKHIYVFPIEKFERDADNETIIRAWKDGEARRYTPEEFAELINDEDFCDVSHWVRAVDDDEDFFEISTLHRDDLEHAGYDASRVDDSVMRKLASKLSDDYCEQLFWNSLPIIADSLGIPQKGSDE